MKFEIFVEESGTFWVGVAFSSDDHMVRRLVALLDLCMFIHMIVAEIKENMTNTILNTVYVVRAFILPIHSLKLINSYKPGALLWDKGKQYCIASELDVNLGLFYLFKGKFIEKWNKNSKSPMKVDTPIL